MSEYEFMQYKMAEQRLRDIRRQNAIELQKAYDDIHPTRTCYDYDLKRLYSESMNPEKYAIYLVEMRNGHERIEEWWTKRAEAYKEAQVLANGDESKIYEILLNIIETRPDLQRKQVDLSIYGDVAEYDSLVEKMNMEELLEDYWDKEGEFDE